MIYAPIIIPTLNRINHLKRCIESLKSNGWAKYTELYISIDYPPSDKYMDGYIQVCDYLSRPIEGFKDVKIYKQEKNLGPFKNTDFLYEKASKEYDRFIFLEDDIEVSHNFIEYMDKGLELFKDDDRFYSVCACGGIQSLDKKNTIMYSKNYSAWGVGLWREKSYQFKKMENRKYFTDIAKSPSKIYKMLREGSSLFLSFQAIIRKKEKLCEGYGEYIPWYDQTIKIHALFSDKYVISSYNRKARNWGFDGSGVNCNDLGSDVPPELEIDMCETFEYIYDDPVEIYELPRLKGLENWVRVGVALIKILWWRITDGT